ncbi:iron ABC transporter permease [Gordonia jinhuaensis]|uniref:Iron ABC transporter permease n=2 Tax=Gordonia jinhuaensis TaxID=1517702 RepID=A0A916TC50_9ACTN|nr:iron ABC transporter permease [Gordonia jinhuaensis]
MSVIETPSTTTAASAPVAHRRRTTRIRMIELLVLVAVLVIALALSIAVGSRLMSLPTVWDALWANTSVPWANAAARGTDAYGIVHQLRIPRTILGLLAGLALGAAGALAQGHTRNPLADPGILGVNAGAACAVVVGVYVLNIATPIQYMGFGLVGALITSALVFVVASAARGSSPLLLVLAGTGLNAMLLAITSAIVLVDSASLDAWRFWNVGSISGRGTDVIWAALPFIAIGLVLAVANGYFLNALSLGDDLSTALGTRVATTRFLGLLALTILAGAATAACGPIAFLGLLAPHIARYLVGPDYRWIVPFAALIGADLLLLCDVIGRVIARPGEIYVGIMVSVIGAPFLIALVRRRKLVAV